MFPPFFMMFSPFFLYCPFSCSAQLRNPGKEFICPKLGGFLPGIPVALKLLTSNSTYLWFKKTFFCHVNASLVFALLQSNCHYHSLLLLGSVYQSTTLSTASLASRNPVVKQALHKKKYSALMPIKRETSKNSSCELPLLCSCKAGAGLKLLLKWSLEWLVRGGTQSLAAGVLH